MQSDKKLLISPYHSEPNMFSNLFFCYVLPFLKKGYTHKIKSEDFRKARAKDLSTPLADELEKKWNYELIKARNNHKTPSLKRAMFKTFGKSYGVFGIWLLFQSVIIRTLLPVVIDNYLKHLQENMATNSIWYWAVGIIILTTINNITYHQCYTGCSRVGMRARIASSSLVYRKVLKLSQSSLTQTAPSHIAKLLSKDVNTLEAASPYLHYIYVTPVQVLCFSYILWNLLGVYAFTGILLMLLEMVPVRGWLSTMQRKFSTDTASDHRVKLMSELVSGLHVIKMYAWEKPFEKLVGTARKLEIDLVQKVAYIKGFLTSSVLLTDRLALFLSLITFVLLGNELKADIVFTAVNIFNVLQLYMCQLFPEAISRYGEASASVERLERFLLQEEKGEEFRVISYTKSKRKPGSVKISDASVKRGHLPILQNLNLRIRPGSLCCIVGDSESGKSSFIHMLLKELPLASGRMDVIGTVSYASQQPWLFSSSIRSNILFGRPYNRHRYREVVKVCGLEFDFQQLPQRDQTIVGGRGLSLSEGQKARISLARAVYVDTDIYLLDDPLFPVDTGMQRMIFEDCIQKFLDNKTRILVTQQLEYLTEADVIIFLENGTISKVLNIQDLSESEISMLTTRSPSAHSEITSSFSEECDLEMVEEDPKKNNSCSNIRKYWRVVANKCLVATLLVIFILSQGVTSLSDLWVTYWVNINSTQDGSTKSFTNYLPTFMDIIPRVSQFVNFNQVNEKYFYIYVYSAIIVACIVLITLRSLLFHTICIKISKILHNEMFSHVVSAPMDFFSVNPSGKILHRFSKDISIVDKNLPNATLNAIQTFMTMLSIFLIVFMVSVWMIIPATLLTIITYYLVVAYLSSAKTIRKYEEDARLPIYSQLSSSLGGISTIRASGAEQMLAEEFEESLNRHTSFSFMSLACSEGFAFYADTVFTVFLTFVTLHFLFFRNENLYSGNIGLAISQSIILIGMLQLGIRYTLETTHGLSSFDRISEYTKIEKETLDGELAPKNWPQLAKISFRSTYLWYAKDKPPALKNLSVVVLPREKIGVVGRGNAGQSTLIASLFRLAPMEGLVAIDDIDTSTLSLSALRSSISIIPQKPTLFSQTVRYNLDPFSRATDDVLWKALEDVDMKGTIYNLSQLVSENGSNFDAGEKRLLCLARAIVRNNKILIVEESSDVDPSTDRLIRKIIREKFKNCTVLTIANNISTVIDSDKVLVMDDGEAVEYSHAHVLLQSPGGHFRKMVEETSPKMQELLRNAARRDFEAKNLGIEFTFE